MINQTQNNIERENRTFRMLVGDDSFANRRNAEDAFLLMTTEMQKVTGRVFSEGRFSDNQNYSIPEFPIAGFDRAEVRVVSSVQEMISEAAGEYNLIVTDMNYGNGYVTGGKDVLRSQAVRQNSAIKAIFTSEDNPKLLEELAELGAKIIVSPTLMKSTEDKTALLGRAIAEYYQTRQIKGNNK